MTYNAPAVLPDFSGGRAFDLLVKQVDFGPRAPNSRGHDSCLAFLLSFLRPLADSVSTQSFAFPGYDGETLRLTNVIATFRPEARGRVLLCAHWDTRPRADREEDVWKSVLPIPGANDGASGVAVLLHLAEIIAQTPPDIGVDIVFFDGEDYGREGDNAMFCIGSKYFAASLDNSYKPFFGILLDLVGDSNAVFPQEEFSVRYAGDIVRMIWSSAAALGIPNFRVIAHDGIIDDHVPLNTTAGIKTVNIIDAELVGNKSANPRRRYWHTLRDTPDQCSPETLARVGKVLLHVIYGVRSS